MIKKLHLYGGTRPSYIIMLHPLSVSLCECFDQQGLLNLMDVKEGTHCRELIVDHFATLNSRNMYGRQ